MLLEVDSIGVATTPIAAKRKRAAALICIVKGRGGWNGLSKLVTEEEIQTRVCNQLL
jgi:hypothetical protein